MSEVTKKTPIVCLKGAEKKGKDDIVIREAHVAVYIEETQVLSAPCLDRERESFVYGALYIQKGLFPEDVERIEWKGLTAFVYLHEDCSPADSTLPLVRTPLEPRFSAAEVNTSVRRFQKLSTLFKETGAVHVAALCRGEEIVDWKEDLSRRTAIDKVVGGWLLSEKSNCGKNKKRGEALENCYLITSGRISNDIAQRAVRIGVPLMVSVAPPSDRAVETAHKYRLTLVGFARPPRMNIYTHSVRIS